MTGPPLLFLTTFIWGTAFLAQKFGAAAFTPLAFTVFRNFLGGGFLLALILLRRRALPAGRFRYSALAGIASGVPLFLAMLAQQIGIESTTPGISAFLTTNYVLFVPLLAAALSRRRPGAGILALAALALAGTYLICMTGSAGGGFAGIGRGELWTLLCAVLFSVQMIVVDRLVGRADLLVMSSVQLFASAVLGAPFLCLPAELSRLGGLAFTWSAVLPLVYCGVFSSGIAYTLQNLGQARCSAPVAAVILSLESVFGALSGYVVLGDRMSPAQFAGCALVFAAALASAFRGGFDDKLKEKQQ